MPEKIQVKLLVTMSGRINGVRHDIDAELELVDSRTVRGLIPGTTRMISGTGRSNLEAVIAWLSQVNTSPSYVPAYQKPKI